MAANRALDYLNADIRRLREASLYRRLRNTVTSGRHIVIDGKRALNLSSNDYLGIWPAALGTIRSQSSSRLISGNDPAYAALEKKLAGHKSQKASLVFPTGYMANIGVVCAIAQKGDLILSDRLNHASLIDAARLSGAEVRVYDHNDMDDLAKKITGRARRKFVITEGIFSMDGDYAELAQIDELASRHGAVTILDDAHGDFVVGAGGRGTPERLGATVDVYTSSLSKGLGSFGGYVASAGEVVDVCINRARPFIYTSALPAGILIDAMRRFDMDKTPNRDRLEANRRQMAGRLAESGFAVSSKTHIIPIMVGDERRAVLLGNYLFRNGVFAQPIRYPTVARGSARLRISVTAHLTCRDIDTAADILEKAGRRFGLV